MSAPYEFLLRSTSDGVLVADEKGVLCVVNPAAAAMLSLTPEELLGEIATHSFSKNPALIHLFEREDQQKAEVRLPRRRLAQGIASTLVTGERMVLLQDITEKRDLENRRENLTRTIAHDLRNPLSATLGFLDLVLKSGDLGDLQKKFLLRARQTTAKIHEMLVSLVDLAWIEAGMPLQHLPVRLDEVINKTINELTDLAKKQNVGIVSSVQVPLPVVMGDPQRLQMVITELLRNAILYSMPEQNVVIHAWGDEAELYCSVADRGIGIADNEQELIFDRMYRSRDERVTEISGGGLGLTIAKTIIKRQGGDLWVVSHLNEGSTFTFVLPSMEQ